MSKTSTRVSRPARDLLGATVGSCRLHDRTQARQSGTRTSATSAQSVEPRRMGCAATTDTRRSAMMTTRDVRVRGAGRLWEGWALWWGVC